MSTDHDASKVFKLRLFSEHALKIRANQMLIFRACSENKHALKIRADQRFIFRAAVISATIF